MQTWIKLTNFDPGFGHKFGQPFASICDTLATMDSGREKPVPSVGHNKVVTMQYALTNADGVVLRDASSRPVTYLHGRGAIPARLEQELESHTVGDIVKARLLPEDAFGRRDLDLVHEVPADEFPASERIEVGGHVTGTDEDGNDTVFTITAINNGVVSLDGNHPLAGQTLVFEVEIQAIRDATEEEIRTGRVSGTS